MTYVIAISNEKGGVAKTTSTFSLGASLVEVGKRVLLIDLDPQANLTLANSIEPASTAQNSSQVLLEGMPARDAIKETNMENLLIIPCGARMSDAEHFLPVRINYQFILREALQQAKLDDFDYVIMDCPPSMGSITINALTASDLLIIPTQAEYFSAYALRDMMVMIRRVRKETNPDLAYRILVTLLDQRNRTHRVIREQLQQTFGAGLFSSIIEIDTRLRESPIVGMPISQYRPKSRGAQQYRVLAEELMEYVKQQKDS
ncbi:MAG: ParA family protein [Anaerolineae bacterium]|jgi:chromosome partitioning protein|nr:ParA family protein [Anaerolineae bacterium]